MIRSPELREGLDCGTQSCYTCVSIEEAQAVRFVTVRQLRGQSAAVWRRLAEEGEMVVTSHGKPVAILSAVKSENLEQSLATLRRARAIAAVQAMQEQSAASGTHRMTSSQIQAEIGAARRSRTK